MDSASRRARPPSVHGPPPSTTAVRTASCPRARKPRSDVEQGLVGDAEVRDERRRVARDLGDDVGTVHVHDRHGRLEPASAGGVWRVAPALNVRSIGTPPVARRRPRRATAVRPRPLPGLPLARRQPAARHTSAPVPASATAVSPGAAAAAAGSIALQVDPRSSPSSGRMCFPVRQHHDRLPLSRQCLLPELGVVDRPRGMSPGRRRGSRRSPARTGRGACGAPTRRSGSRCTSPFRTRLTTYSGVESLLKMSVPASMAFS